MSLSLFLVAAGGAGNEQGQRELRFLAGWLAAGPGQVDRPQVAGWMPAIYIRRCTGAAAEMITILIFMARWALGARGPNTGRGPKKNGFK
jgi:hypothetical protein